MSCFFQRLPELPRRHGSHRLVRAMRLQRSLRHLSSGNLRLHGKQITAVRASEMHSFQMARPFRIVSTAPWATTATSAKAATLETPGKAAPRPAPSAPARLWRIPLGRKTYSWRFHPRSDLNPRNFSDTCAAVDYGRGYVCNACKPGYTGQYCER